MADDVTLPGVGAKVATDDVGGSQYQKIKLDVGGDGASVPVVGSLPVSGPLTDTQLRATAVPVSLESAPLATGAASATGQAAIVAAIQAIPGAPGTVALDGTTLAALESVTVQSSALPTGAATETTIAALSAKTPALGQAAAAASSPVVLASDQPLIPANTLGQPGVARKITTNAAGGASAEVTLTTTCRRVSMVATGGAQRYVVGTGAQTALATSHYIQQGERLDVNVPANARIAAISDTASPGGLEITELL